jgi:hypothetical protein
VDIFLTQPGVAVALYTPGIPMTLYLDGWQGYEGFKSIITSFSVQTQSGVQYMNTLRDLIFVYVFNERVAPLNISGISFAAACEELQGFFQPVNHGLEYAFAYYLNARVSSYGLPVTIVLGLSTPFYGFLDKGSFQINDAERLLGQFSFGFTAIPQPGLLDLLTP